MLAMLGFTRLQYEMLDYLGTLVAKSSRKKLLGSGSDFPVGETVAEEVSRG